MLAREGFSAGQRVIEFITCRAVKHLDGGRVRIEWDGGYFEGAASADVEAQWGTVPR